VDQSLSVVHLCWRRCWSFGSIRSHWLTTVL